MKTLQQLRTAATLKALKEQGLDNANIVQLVKTDGWAEVQSLVRNGDK